MRTIAELRLHRSLGGRALARPAMIAAVVAGLVAVSALVDPLAPLPVVVGYAVGGVLMVRSGRHLVPEEAVAWRIIGWALLVAVVGMVAVAVASTVNPSLPTFSAFDLIFVSSYLIAGIGFARMPQFSERGGSGIRTLLDGFIGAASGAALLWVYVASDLVMGFQTADPWPRAMGSLTIIADMSLVVVVVIVLVRRGSWRFDPRVLLLAAGLVLQVIGNFIFFSSGVASALTHSAQPYPIFALAGCCAAGAGLLIGRKVRTTEYPLEHPAVWALLAPYSMSVVVVAAAAFQGIGGAVSADGVVLISTSVLVVGLTIARQALAIRDVTSRVEVERRGLIASVSHELRTPLTAVIGFLELLSDADLPEPDRREMQSLALDQARYLGRMVGDLVDLSRDTLSSAQLRRTEVSVAGLVGEVAHATNAGLITVDVPKDLRADVDSDRMRQLLTNLVSNAQRYGGGQIAVVATQSQRDLILEVHDDGPGVPRPFEKVIWDRFERGAHRLDSVTPGSGIGLALVDAMARAHGGEATYARSELLGGACFTVRLPGVVVPDRLEGSTVIVSGHH